MLSKKILIIIAVALVLVIAGGAAVFFLTNSNSDGSLSGTYKPRVKQDETTFSFIANAEVTKDSSNTYGDVFVTLSGGESTLILESDRTAATGSSTEQQLRVYESIEVSPNQRYAAIQGQEFGNPFVFVYQAFTGNAQEKVAGRFTGWTIDGRMQITQCPETDEECLERTSENSKDPWVLTQIIIVDESILGSASLSPDVDFITNIQSVGNLSTFSRMIKAGGRFIDGAGPFTILAPTNAAFSKMDQTILNNLFKPENKTELQRLLRNHIIVPQYTVKEMSEKTDLLTAENTLLAVSSTTPAVINNKIEVEIPDIVTSNGIIHIVDTVLIEETSSEPVE